jgi:hypothetical protein
VRSRFNSGTASGARSSKKHPTTKSSHAIEVPLNRREGHLTLRREAAHRSGPPAGNGTTMVRGRDGCTRCETEKFAMGKFHGVPRGSPAGRVSCHCTHHETSAGSFGLPIESCRAKASALARHRPRSRRTAEQPDESAAVHSIISSARPSSLEASALAVFRLMASLGPARPIYFPRCRSKKRAISVNVSFVSGA